MVNRLIKSNRLRAIVRPTGGYDDDFGSRGKNPLNLVLYNQNKQRVILVNNN